jgi:hypothetical protein
MVISGSGNRITYFDTVPVMPSVEEIMSRLGYNKSLTSLSAGDKCFIDASIQLGLALCRNQGAACRFTVKEHKRDMVIFGDNESFESSRLSGLLSNSDEILLMAGTAGPEIMNRINSEMESGNVALAVVLDAVGSQAADVILDWMMEFYKKILRREGKRLTMRRYSPGYGDLPPANQAIIFRLLGLERLKLKLTESMMLVPEKSVLAVAGIEGIQPE